MPELLINGGQNTLCAVGVWEDALNKVGEPLGGFESDPSKRISARFAVDHPIYRKDASKFPQSWIDDYHKYLDVVIAMFGLKKDKHGYIITPKVNYPQLVFLITLIRHPIELKRDYDNGYEDDWDDGNEDANSDSSERPMPNYPFIYQRMRDWKVDPFGALVSLTITKTCGFASGYNDYKGPYANSWGHGFLDVAQELNRHEPPVKSQCQQLCGITAFNLLKEADDTIGDLWSRAHKHIGLLDVPRKFSLYDVLPPKEVKPKPRVKRKRVRTYLELGDAIVS